MSPLRQKIAARLLSAQQETAHLTTFNEIDLSNVIALRAKYQDRFVKKTRSSSLHVVLREGGRARAQGGAGCQRAARCARSCRTISSTSAWHLDRQGLLVPVLRDADQLSFAGVEKHRRLRKKARDGKIQFSTSRAGSSPSPTGTFGSSFPTPILNPPSAASSACTHPGTAGRDQRPRGNPADDVRRAHLRSSPRRRKEAVTFLVTVKEIVENPAAVLLEV